MEDIVTDLAKLTQTEIGEQLKNLKEWSPNQGKLYTTLVMVADCKPYREPTLDKICKYL